MCSISGVAVIFGATRTVIGDAIAAGCCSIATATATQTDRSIEIDVRVLRYLLRCQLQIVSCKYQVDYFLFSKLSATD